MNALETLNQNLFLQLNASAETPHWIISLATLLANDLIYLIPLAMAIVWTRGDPTERNPALKACVVTFIALGINQLIAIALFHPRPAALGLGHTFTEHAQDSSFPSDHATVFWAVGLTMVFHNVRSTLALSALIGGLIVAWARIFLGVHYPLDMLGAALVVSFTWLGITPFWKRIGDLLTLSAERLYRVVLSGFIRKGWLHP